MGENDWAMRDDAALLAALAEVPERVAALLVGHATTDADADAGDGWTTSEIVGHLCDSARVWGGRALLTLHEDRPALPPFDENGFVRLAAYRYRPAQVLAGEVRLLMQPALDALRAAPPAAWERIGVHGERGPLALRDLVRIWAEHDTGHLDQLARSLHTA